MCCDLQARLGLRRPGTKENAMSVRAEGAAAGVSRSDSIGRGGRSPLKATGINAVQPTGGQGTPVRAVASSSVRQVSTHPRRNTCACTRLRKRAHLYVCSGLSVSAVGQTCVRIHTGTFHTNANCAHFNMCSCFLVSAAGQTCGRTHICTFPNVSKIRAQMLLQWLRRQTSRSA